MAAPVISRAAIPRFLLPQTSWTSTSTFRSAAQCIVDARRHRFSTAPERCATNPVTSALTRQRILRSGKEAASFAAGYASTLEFHRRFSATAPQAKDHHFDTLKFVQRLKEEGFTDEQAEGMMRVLSDVIEERYIFMDNSWRAFG